MAAEASKTAQDKAQEDIDKLREELELMRQTVEGLGPAAKAGARAARSAAHDAADTAQAKAREYGETAATAVRDSVHTHPLMSLGVAFAAGALAALLLRR